MIWPYAAFRPYKFSRGRERAPSIHATEAPHPRYPNFFDFALARAFCKPKGCPWPAAAAGGLPNT